MSQLNILKRREIKTHVDAVVHFIQVLDEEMVFDLLDDVSTYQDMPRHIFISKLGEVFDVLEKSGDEFLNASLKIDGVYDGIKVQGYSFVGNNSKNYIDLMFEIDHQGYVTDIFEYEDVDEKIPYGTKEARLFLEDYVYDYVDDEYDDYTGDDFGSMN